VLLGSGTAAIRIFTVPGMTANDKFGSKVSAHNSVQERPVSVLFHRSAAYAQGQFPAPAPILQAEPTRFHRTRPVKAWPGPIRSTGCFRLAVIYARYVWHSTRLRVDPCAPAIRAGDFALPRGRLAPASPTLPRLPGIPVVCSSWPASPTYTTDP
jgi:hypothetical protein